MAVRNHIDFGPPDPEMHDPPSPLGASPDGPLLPADTMSVSLELAAMVRHQIGLAEEALLPDLDTFLAQWAVLGSAEDLQWLVAVCCRPGETRAHLNVGRVRQHLQALEDERRTATAKIMEQARAIKTASTTATLSMDQAADLFYQYCYPDVQECLDIAVEQLQQPRSRIILAALGHYKDELHGVDVTNALEAEDMVATPGARINVTAFPQQTTVAFLQRQCPVCQSTFQPEKDKPKQLYCRQACGDLAYATQTWASNAANYGDMRTLPYPDPYQHGVPLGKRTEALAWQDVEAPKMLDQAEKRMSDLRMRAH